MSSSSSSLNNDSFYTVYKDSATLPFHFVLFTFLRFLIGFSVVLLNISLVIVTVKNKSLHNHCTLLILMEVLAIAILQSNVIISFGLLLSGYNFISLANCCLILQFVPLVGFTISYILPLIIAADRICAVVFCFWYARLSHHRVLYLTTILLGCVLVHAVLLRQVFSWILFQKPKDTNVLCMISECTADHSFDAIPKLLMSLGACCIVIYITLWAVLRYKMCQQGEAQNLASTRRIFKALLALTSLYLGLIFAMNAVRYAVGFAIQWTDTERKFATLVVNTVHNMSYFFYVPILYTFSEEYRAAYRRTFSGLYNYFSQSNAVVATTNLLQQVNTPRGSRLNQQDATGK